MSAGARWSDEEWKLAQERVLEHLAALAAPDVELLGGDGPAPTPRGETSLGPLFRRAAVRSRFRMEELAAADASPDEVRRLQEASVELRDGSGWRTLEPDVRNEVLAQLTTPELAQLLIETPEESDPLRHVLQRAGKGIDAAELQHFPPGELAALVQVHSGLSSIANIPPLADVERKLDLARLLEPLTRITSTFSGRKVELQQLREYVGVVPPAPNLLRTITPSFVPIRKAPFQILGDGGLGKTTLVARFILEHALLDAKLQFPFAYLDFDRPSVMAERPGTIFIEAVRQMGLQYGEAYEASELFRQRWEQRLRTVPAGDSSLNADLVDNFVLFLDTLEVREGPMLFVLDTFEEVQNRSSFYAKSVIDLVQTLADRVPRLRMVVAGRKEVPGVTFEGTIVLTQFDRDSAIAYLGGQAVDPVSAAAIYDAFGGSPLSLSLAAQLYNRDPEELRGQRDFRIDLAQFTDEVVQAELFDRVLGHIEDPDIQRLAHPGLILRRVTPDLIREVLAGPCGIEVRDAAHAQKLFDKLADESTLVALEDDVLVYRPDVRRMMLPRIRHNASRKVDEIHRSAIAYYSGRTDPVSRAEEIYHRLSLGQTRAEVEPLVSPELEPLLSDAREEFALPEQALLASLFKLELEPEVRRAADDQTWERETSRRLQEMLRSGGDPTIGEALLAERSTRSTSTDLRITEVLFHLGLAQHQRAQSLADRGIELYRAAGENDLLFRMLLAASEVDLEMGELDRAHSRLADAEDLARHASDPLLLLRVLRGRAAFQRTSGQSMSDDLTTQLIDACAHVADADWATDLPLLRSVAEEVGRKAPGIVARAVRLGALELSLSSLEAVRQVLEQKGLPAEDVRGTLADIMSRGTPTSDLLDAVLSGARSDGGQRSVVGSVQSNTPSVRLSMMQRKRLRDLLTRHLGAQLTAFAESRFHIALEAVSFSGAGTPATAMDLIRAAERDGWIAELLVGLARAKFEEGEVLRFMDSLGMGPTLVGTPSLPEEELRAIVNEYRGRVGSLEARTCTIGDPEQKGSCMLVGDNQVLTAPEALRDVSIARATFRFDRVTLNQEMLGDGFTCDVAHVQSWRSRRGTRVLQIDASLGQSPLEATRSADLSPRGTVQIRTQPYTPGEPLLWLWREERGTFISGIRPKETRTTDDGRVILNAPATPLMAGCPCVDAAMNVVGFHRGPDEAGVSTMMPLDPTSFGPATETSLTRAQVAAVRDGLLARFATRAAFRQFVLDEISFDVDRYVDAGASLASTVRQVIYAAESQGWLGRLVDVLYDTILPSPPREWHEDMFRVYTGDRIFVNRAELRAHLRRMMMTNGPRILLVDGERGSGRSYTNRFIDRLAGILDFQFIDINLNAYGGSDTIRAYDLGLTIVESLNFQVPPQLDVTAARWSVNFFRYLAAQIGTEDRRKVWVAFDNFDTASLSPEALDFIAMLVLETTRNLPTFRCVLIGYHGSLPAEVKPFTLHERTPAITPADLTSFFVNFYAEQGLMADPTRISEAVARVAARMNELPWRRLANMHDALAMECEAILAIT
jgi:hypothetical protein